MDDVTIERIDNDLFHIKRRGVTVHVKRTCDMQGICHAFGYVEDLFAITKALWEREQNNGKRITIPRRRL